MKNKAMTDARDTARWGSRVLTILVLAIACMGLPTGTARAADWPDSAYVLQVDGLACPYCGYGVEKQFSKQAGVVDTDIDIEQGVVIVSVAPGTRFRDSELERIVHDAGFALGDIVRRPRGDP